MQIAKFKILTSFKITGRGLIIVGDIIEGEIQIGNWITFKHDNIEYRREIKAIEMIDKIADNFAYVGLILNHPNPKEKEKFSQFKLVKHIVEIAK